MRLIFDFLPSYLQEIVQKLADVHQIDTDYALTGLFSASAAALGDRYRVIDPKGYRNATALWLCQIGISGYGKSQCASWLMEPLLENDEMQHNRYKQEYAQWERSDAKQRGEKPKEKKLVLNDYTPEALFASMENAGSNGILLYRDELAGWLKDMGRYGKSGEVEQYLTAWSQQPVRVTRLLRDDNFIKRPCFNVFGGIQPEILHEMLGKDDLIANGFNSRFLFVHAADSLSTDYFRESVPDSMKEAYKAIIQRLLSISEKEVRFSTAAEESFIHYWEDLQKRKTTSNSMVRQLLSKLQIYIEKWAGLVALLANNGTMFDKISGNAMDTAICHMRVFEEWAVKAYHIIRPGFDNDALSEPELNKKATLQQLVKQYPTMNKNMVAQGLGISRSMLSPSRGKVGTPEVNIPKDEIN